MDERGLPSRSALVAHVGRLAGWRVLVIGDLVLDEYIVGRAARLSREAPIPVLELTDEFRRPGAACNPAANVAALGSTPQLVGVVGDDPAGQALTEELQAAGIDATGLVRGRSRRTATKTRILAEHVAAHRQQVARIDRTPSGRLDPGVEARLVERIRAAVPNVDAVLVSDYKLGVVGPRTIEEAVAAARRAGKPIAVDSQGDLQQFRGFTLVKSNQPDAEAALRTRLETDQDFAQAGRTLRDELAADYVVITRGAQGMSVIAVDNLHVHVPPANRTEVWDVTGAGDTVIAVLTLGLAAGIDVVAAAELANLAAGLVVRRLGVATVAPAELIAAIEASSARS